MMTRVLTPTSNRKRLFHFLTRARRFHANVSTLFEYDVTPLMSSIKATRERGEPASVVSALVKATGLVLERYPRFNRHLFHGVFGRYEVEFGSINCSLVISRPGPEGEDVLFPCVIRDSNRLSVAEVEEILRDYRQKPITELAEYQAFRRLENMPQLGRLWVSFKARSDHRFYEKFFVGTYGLSSGGARSRTPALATHALSPAAVSFFPGTITDRAWVIDGAVVPRKILPMTIVTDHFVVDGSDYIPAMDYLGELFDDPTRLGLAQATNGAGVVARGASA